MSGLTVTAQNALEVSEGIWLVDLPPNQVKFFGDCKTAEGERSILLASNPQFNIKAKSLTFEAGGVLPLNIGASNTAVVLRSKARSLVRLHPSKNMAFDSGDKKFLSELELLPDELAAAAKILLSTVRAKAAGDLKLAQLGRYVNSPDNFWTVKVQPRVKNLAFTVRGVPERFGKSPLEIKPDQHGYSRFWLKEPGELQEVLRIIFSAQRRG